MAAAPSPLLLQVQGVHKRFGDNVVLAGADLDVPRGTLVTVLGRSGTGKSVFLKCLADVMPADEGRILFDGRPLTIKDAQTRADFRRRCSFLFQSNALFDSLTALENVALPLEQTTNLSDHEIVILVSFPAVCRSAWPSLVPSSRARSWCSLMNPRPGLTPCGVTRFF
jgi:phospholipid/cholesterol/gamma-HCH transport system ATP-binding protein